MKPRRWLNLRNVVILVVLVLMTWGVSTLLFESRFKIGRETTFVTGPTKSDGQIDFAEALHEKLSAGVKPENNAVVLLVQAFGPGAISAELRPRYFEYLSIDPPPEQGDYVVSEEAFITRRLGPSANSSEPRERMSQQFERSRKRPWMRSDLPEVADWLDINAKPLDLIEQASQRSQYYSPVVTNESLVSGETMTQHLRAATRLLTARARLRMRDNNVASAWNDLLICHRLALLSSRNAPNMRDFLVAVAVDSAASFGDETLIAYGLPAEQARKCLADHAKLSLIGSLIDVVDFGQRLETLDAMIHMDQLPSLFHNTMLRQANLFYDDFVTALKKGAYEQRIQEIKAVENRLNQRIGAAKKPLSGTIKMLMSPAENTTDVLLGLLSPALTQAVTAETRVQVRHDLVQIGFALAAHHSDHDSYPATLDELAPHYLNTIPLDRYSGKPLIYVVREDGFLIYSVGANQRDDDGSMAQPSLTPGTAKDDVAFQIPQKVDD